MSGPGLFCRWARQIATHKALNAAAAAATAANVVAVKARNQQHEPRPHHFKSAPKLAPQSVVAAQPSVPSLPCSPAKLSGC